MTATPETIIRELLGADAPAETFKGFMREIDFEKRRWRSARHFRNKSPTEKRKIKELAKWASLVGPDEIATALNAIEFSESRRGRPYDWHRFYVVLQLSDIYERAGGRIGLSMDGGRPRDTGFYKFVFSCAREAKESISGIDGVVRKVLEYRRLHLKE